MLLSELPFKPIIKNIKYFNNYNQANIRINIIINETGRDIELKNINREELVFNNNIIVDIIINDRINIYLSEQFELWSLVNNNTDYYYIINRQGFPKLACALTKYKAKCSPELRQWYKDNPIPQQCSHEQLKQFLVYLMDKTKP